MVNCSHPPILQLERPVSISKGHSSQNSELALADHLEEHYKGENIAKKKRADNMTVPELSTMVTATPTLTPIQEKAIFGVDVPRYFEVVNSGTSSEDILDSTLAVMKKIDDGDKELIESWMKAKTISNQFDYAVLMYLLTRYQQQSHEDANVTNGSVLKKLASVDLKSLPSSSNIMAWDALNEISLFLSETSFKTCSNIESFTNIFSQLLKGDDNFTKILYFYFAFNHFKNSPTMLEAVSANFKSFLDSLQKQVKFPTANQTNQQGLDPFLKLAIYLMQNNSLRTYLDIYKITNKFIYVTYQDVRIMKLWCLNSLHLGLLDEAKATFRTYLNYVADYKMKNNGEYYDIMDVIQTYIQVLQSLSFSMTSNEEYNVLKTWFDELQDIMKIFTAVIGDDVKVFKNPLRVVLADAYFSLGKIFENFLKMEPSPVNKIDEIVQIFGKSVDSLSRPNKDLKMSSSKLSEIYYTYSFYLHKSSKHDLASKYAKCSMKFSPDNVKYINYYVKLLSNDEENFDNSLLISQQVIQNLTESISNEDCLKWSVKRKSHALEAYLIFLTLLGDAAIDALPPFFAFVNKLFGDQHSVSSGTIDSRNTTKSPAISRGGNKVTLNGSADDGCAPCTPNSSASLSINHIAGEKKLRSILNPLKLRSRDHKNTDGAALRPTTSPKKLGQTIRKSLQVNKLSHSNNGREQEQNGDAINKTTNYGSLTPREITLLRTMWLTLSRIFQSVADLETALQCVEEADGYSIPSMILSTKSSRSKNTANFQDDVTEEQIHRAAIAARRGCVNCANESVDVKESGKATLLDVLSIIEAAGGVRKWPQKESITAAETVVGLTQICLQALEDATESKHRQEYTACLARCRKHLELLLETVDWSDDARGWLVLCEVYGQRNMSAHDNENVAISTLSQKEEECVLRAVHGWHGLQILQ